MSPFVPTATPAATSTSSWKERALWMVFLAGGLCASLGAERFFAPPPAVAMTWDGDPSFLVVPDPREKRATADLMPIRLLPPKEKKGTPDKGAKDKGAKDDADRAKRKIQGADKPTNTSTASDTSKDADGSPPKEHDNASATTEAESDPARVPKPKSPPLPPVPDEERGADRRVLRVDIDGIIAPLAAERIQQAIDRAVAEGAEAVLVRLDTPGGLLSATRDIVRSMLSSKVPVIVWVAPEGAHAGSAGVFITLAGHVAVMAPGTRIGAAHPVTGSGENIEGDMRDKVTNDTAAFARSIAEQRYRNADWAERAVRDSDSISDSQALTDNVIDFVARDLREVLRGAHGRQVEMPEGPKRLVVAEAEVETIHMTISQWIVFVLSNPNVVFVLMLLGMLGLYIEYQAPGLIVPGLVGALCLALVFGVQTLPVNGVGVLLIVGAAVVLIAEVYVPSFGILTAVGLTALVLGALTLFDVPDAYLRIDISVIVAAVAGFGGAVLMMGYFIAKTLRQGATSGAEALPGHVGEVLQTIPVGGRGRILLEGAYWNAAAPGATTDIPVKAKVRLKAMNGLLAEVEPLPDVPSDLGPPEKRQPNSAAADEPPRDDPPSTPRSADR